MRPIRRRTAVPAAVVLSAAVLSGCAGTASADPVSAVTGARAKVVGAGTSRVALSSTTTVGTQKVTFSGAGAFDYGHSTGKLDLTVGGASAATGTIHELVTGGNLYLSLPAAGTSYYKLSLTDLVGTSLGSSTDPTAPLASLQGVASGVTKVGSEQVRGTRTTHYRGSIDVKKALARTTGTQHQLLAATLQSSGLTTVPFDAYIDGQGRLRKYVQVASLPGSSATGGQKVVSTTTTELYDFGTTVSVTAPPAAQVKDGAPLLQALKAAGKS